MSLHKKPIKAHGEKVSERTSELHSSSVFILLSLIPVPPPPSAESQTQTPND